MTEENKVITELKSMRKESMELKLQIKDDIHKIDTRLVKMETKWKMIVPMIGVFFGFIGAAIKSYFFGMKG